MSQFRELDVMVNWDALAQFMNPPEDGELAAVIDHPYRGRRSLYREVSSAILPKRPMFVGGTYHRMSTADIESWTRILMEYAMGRLTSRP